MIYGNHIPEVNVTEASLLRRVEVFLEDGEFERADDYCEKVLDINVSNGEAYFYKLLAALKLRSRDELEALEEPIDTQPCYAKIMRFGSVQLKKEVEAINAAIIKRAEERQKTLSFENAMGMLESQSIPELTAAYRIFVSLGSFSNAEASAEDCKNRIEAIYDARYNELYLQAKQKEQEISDINYQNSTDIAEKDDYDQYIKENQRKKVFDYSIIASVVTAILGIAVMLISANEYLSLSGVSFKTVALCILTRIVPGAPLTGIATLVSFHVSKKLIKKQKANLLEDIGTAAERAKKISEKINNSESEVFMLKQELDENLEALRILNSEYDEFAAASKGNQQ